MKLKETPWRKRKGLEMKDEGMWQALEHTETHQPGRDAVRARWSEAVDEAGRHRLCLALQVVLQLAPGSMWEQEVEEDQPLDSLSLELAVKHPSAQPRDLSPLWEPRPSPAAVKDTEVLETVSAELLSVQKRGVRVGWPLSVVSVLVEEVHSSVVLVTPRAGIHRAS